MALGVMVVLNIIAASRLPYYVTILFSVIFGFFLGAYQVFFGFEFLKRVPFLLRIFIQLLTVQLLIMVTIVISNLILTRLEINIYNINIFILLTDEIAVIVYIKVQIFAVILIFFKELETLLGKQFLRHFIFDTYRNPKTERRLIMFADLRNSTSITERIGDIKYYHFLNDCYSLLNMPAFSTGAEVLKYVGDEVVLSWNIGKKPKADSAMQFYAFFKSQLEQKRSYFLKEYGAFPEFTVGLHQGEVVTAFLGDIKKQLDLSGDLMNTASRICGICSKLGQEVLMTGAVYENLNSTDLKMRVFEDVTLRGKAEPLSLYSIIL